MNVQSIGRTPGEIFRDVHAVAAPIPYSEAWENGTGYLDGAVAGADAPVVAVGEIVGTATPAGRPILIIGTELGNVVVFKRYTNHAQLFAWHASHHMRKFIGNAVANAVEAEPMKFLFGVSDEPNIHERFLAAEPELRTAYIERFQERLTKYGTAGE